MGILLGLLTALSWGSSDFLARFAARRVGSRRTTLYMQLAGFVLLTICLPWIGGWGHLFDGSGWKPWAWGALAGVLNSVATLSLYRSFEIGKLAVVAPVSASYPALTVALAVFSGEHLTTMRATGIALVLVGVVIVVRGEVRVEELAGTTPPGPIHKAVSGIGAALISAVGFGVLFWLLGNRVVPRVGAASTVWMIRLTSAAVTAAVILALRQPILLPRHAAVTRWLLGIGILDTGAFVLNNLGMQLEQVSVVSVLASLYGAVTVLLSTVVLRERLSRQQWLGMVAIFAGIAFISR
jgi:drug/metabolite transporter (DMT)-like permease